MSSSCWGVIMANNMDMPFELLSPQEQQNKILDLLRPLAPVKSEKYKKIRVGSPGDGGYVQLDDFKNISHAFSFGISDNDSWDLEVAKRGIPVEQFDHSIDCAPSSHPLLNFHKKMIATAAGPDTATLPDLVREFSKKTTPDLLLNIDIEGAEWDVFDDASSADLNKFAQICCEFHNLENLSHPGFFPKAKRVFDKLSENFVVVHVHGNNCCGIRNVHNISLPCVIEFTFANKTATPHLRAGKCFRQFWITQTFPMSRI